MVLSSLTCRIFMSHLASLPSESSNTRLRSTSHTRKNGSSMRAYGEPKHSPMNPSQYALASSTSESPSLANHESGPPLCRYPGHDSDTNRLVYIVLVAKDVESGEVLRCSVGGPRLQGREFETGGSFSEALDEALTKASVQRNVPLCFVCSDSNHRGRIALFRYELKRVRQVIRHRTGRVQKL
jgi:hypothetical protein